MPETGKGENRHLILDDIGAIQADCHKRFLLVLGDMGQTAVIEKGAEMILMTGSPYGGVPLAICRDMSFPRFALQVERSGTDTICAMYTNGRFLARMDRGAGEAEIMNADVPSRGVRTPHARFGDWLGWVSVGLTLVPGLAALLSGLRPWHVAGQVAA